MIGGRTLLIMVIFFSWAWCFGQGKGDEKIFSNSPYRDEPVIPFISSSDQSDWDLKRQIGRLVNGKPIMFFDDDFILDMKGLTRTAHTVANKEPISIWETSADKNLYGELEIRQLLRSPDGKGYLAYFNGEYNEKLLITLYHTNDGQNFKPVYVNQLAPEMIWDDLDKNDLPENNNVLAFSRESEPKFNLAQKDNFTSFFEFPVGKKFKYGAFFINKLPHPRLSYLFGSMDGINWSPIEHHQLIIEKESNRPSYNPFNDKYLAYLRHWDPELGACTRWRKVKFSESYEKDGELYFSDPKLVFEADELDPAGADIYNMFVFSYAGKFIGMPEIYNRRSSLVSADLLETITVELAFSHDGYNWKRINQGKQFIPQGDGNSWDSGMIFALGSPVIIDNHLFFYYSGTNRRHHESGDSPAAGMDRLKKIGRGSLRVDGFVSLDAGPAGGILVTVPFYPQGKYLFINADARDGEIGIEVLRDGHSFNVDDSGPLGLFRIDKCIPIKGDSIAHLVRWEQGENFKDYFPKGWNDELLYIPRERRVEETAIALKIFMRNAKLYSFWFSDEKVPAWSNRLLPAVDKRSNKSLGYYKK